jgi:hypothetical protein
LDMIWFGKITDHAHPPLVVVRKKINALEI